MDCDLHKKRLGRVGLDGETVLILWKPPCVMVGMYWSCFIIEVG